MQGVFYKRKEVLLGIVFILIGVGLSAGAFYYLAVKKQAPEIITENHEQNISTTTAAATSSEKVKKETPAVSWCEADYSQSSEMAAFAKTADNICEKNYPKIKQKLDKTNPTRKILLVFKKNQEAPGMTSGNTIYLSSQWFLQNPGDLGAIVHEVVHVAQAYPSYVFWPTEGIADYIRYWAGYQNSWSYAHCAEGSLHYTSGYWCSAAFLQYIERVYDSQIIYQINLALKANNYSDSLFLTYTGKTLDELWQECKSADCQGGRP